MGPIVDRVGVAGGGRRRWPAPAGLVGFGLASLMVILGTVAGTDSLRRAFGGWWSIRKRSTSIR
jgi:hypothetical protein